MIVNETLGAAASAKWLEARRLDAKNVPHWYVEIAIGSDIADTGIDVNIYPEEWGFVFRHGARVSSIRVTDIPFIHGRDDFGLLRDTPELEHLGELLAVLERRLDIKFHRVRPTVKANVDRAAAAVGRWLVHP